MSLQPAERRFVTEANVNDLVDARADEIGLSNEVATEAAQTAVAAAGAASTKAGEAATSATAAAGSATAAGTAETAAETARTAAQSAQTAAETAKTAAETAGTTATTKAGEAAGSATTASTKAGEAAASATTAAGHATTATTKAGEAATSATNADTARTGAETARTGAETARAGAETAQTAAQGHATTASTKAGEAATSATNAAGSATTAGTKAGEAAGSASAAAGSAAAAASSAADAAAWINGFDIGTVTTGAVGANAAATMSGTAPNRKLNLTLPRGATGSAGRGISAIARTSGNGAAGTTDTYTITYTDATTSTFTVVNGTNGTGSGDVSGPASAVSANIPAFSGTTGKAIVDSGYSTTDLLLARGQMKQVVTVATTVNITLSGTQTIDGVAVVAGQRVLVKNQTDPTQNGIYVVAAGAWTRATDFDVTVESNGALVSVVFGATNTGTVWITKGSGGATLGTVGITWYPVLDQNTGDARYPLKARAVGALGAVNASRIFRDVLHQNVPADQATNAGTQAILRTKIPYGTTMFRIKVQGYNYTGGNALDLDIAAYAYTAAGPTYSFPTGSWQSNGSVPVTSVTGYRDASNNVVLVIVFGQTMDYPVITIPEVYVGYTTATLDSMGAGWTWDWSTDLTGLTSVAALNQRFIPEVVRGPAAAVVDGKLAMWSGTSGRALASTGWSVAELLNLGNGSYTGTLPDTRLPARLGIYGAQIADANTALTSGRYVLASTATNTPTAGSWWMLDVHMYDSDEGKHEITRLASPMEKYVRHISSGGIIGPWQRVRYIETELDARYLQPSSSLDATKLTGVAPAASLPVASDTASGAVERATDAEALAAIDTTRYVTPAQVAAYVANALSIAGAPALLNTIDEIAQALNDDPAAFTTLSNMIATKQPLDATLTALAGLTVGANQLIYATGADTFATSTLSAFARTILDDADASTVLSTLGVSAYAKTLLDDADAAAARGTLGLGTAATQASTAFAPAAHNHNASEINAGTLADARLPARLGIYAKSTTDWNTAIESGLYMASAAANAPTPDSTWYLGFVTAHNTLWVQQEVWAFTNVSGKAGTTTQKWRRWSSDATGVINWGPWVYLQETRVEQDARYSQLGHTHDDRYYTEGEIDTLLAAVGVTAEQVAADWNTAVETGFYWSSNHTIANRPDSSVNASGETWYGRVIKRDANVIMQTITLSSTGRTYTRSGYNGGANWGAWVEEAPRLATLDATYLKTADAPELIRDTMGVALVAGTGITITPDDTGDTITIASTAGSDPTVVYTATTTADLTTSSTTGAQIVTQLNLALGTGDGQYEVEMEGFYITASTGVGLGLYLNGNSLTFSMGTSGAPVPPYRLWQIESSGASVAPVGALDATSPETGADGPTNGTVGVPARFYYRTAVRVTGSPGDIQFYMRRTGGTSANVTILRGATVKVRKIG